MIENPLFFYKEFIAKNKPCKILNAVNNWSALETFKDINHLKKCMEITNQNKISVDVNKNKFIKLKF